MAAITVKHSSELKQSDVTSHNKALDKMEEKFKQWNVSFAPFTRATLEHFTNSPGYYYKDKGEWRGPYETEEYARDAKAEVDFERKHG